MASIPPVDRNPPSEDIRIEIGGLSQQPMLSPPHRSRGDRVGLVVFSGGSAANSLVDVFEHVRQQNSFVLSYIIPISDNGGSSSEIIRVFGGPGKYLDRLIDALTEHVGQVSEM